MTARFRTELLLLLLIMLAVLWASHNSPYYLSYKQISYSLQQTTAIVGLLALGLMLVVLVGEIDISLPAIMAFANIGFAFLSQRGVPIALAAPLILAMTTAAGAANGLLVVGFGLPSLAVTLGALGAWRALALLLGGNEGYADFSDAYVWLGSASLGPLPASLILLVLAFLAVAALLHASTFGRMLYTIGANAVAARMSGIRVARVKVAAFALAGLIAGIASLVYIGQYQSARADNAGDMLLLIVTVVVLGGIDIFGGSGSPLGLFLALLLVGTLKNGMGLANLPGPQQTLVIGLVLVASVLAAQSDLRPGRWLPGALKGARGRSGARR